MHQEDIEELDKFLYTLEWLLAVAKRYSGHIQFGLAHIAYKNPSVLGDAYGAREASAKLDEFSHALRKAFRKTDLVARDGMDFWVLVPYTPVNEKLADKLAYIIETASQGGLQIVQRDISIFSLSQDVAKLYEDFPALGFLKYLKKNHLTLASREISLPHAD